MENERILYQKFCTSRQERVRLELALWGFFQEETEQNHRQEYARYLQRRIRPAVEALIASDDLEHLQSMEALGWLDEAVVEDCLKAAIRLKKIQAFLWLLGIKAEKYGFPDRGFDL